MNRQVFTLMTVFLMLGALWNGAWGATNEDYTDKIYEPFGDNKKFTSQYYLIGDGNGNFLKAGEDGGTFTILSEQTIKLNDDSSEDDKLSALWAIEPTQVGPQLFTYKIKSKKTGHYLKFKKDTNELPEESDNPDNDTFKWFDSNIYTESGKPLYVTSTGGGIVISNENDATTQTRSISIATSNLTNLKVYTLKNDDMKAEELNQQMGNGFILAAKNGNTDIKVEDNSLLNRKLVAFSFYVSAKFSQPNNNVNVKKIIGIDPTVENAPKEKRMYLAVSGYEDLMKYVEENYKYTINIKEGEDGNVENVIAAFKKATFVAVDKEQNHRPIGATTGLGYQYTTFTGKDLLSAGNKEVPIENAQFNIKNNANLGSTSTSDYLIITNPYAFFPDDNGNVNKPIKEENDNNEEIFIGVRPYIKESENIENKKYYLTSAPANGDYKWTHIGFTSGGGIINYYSHLKGNKYTVTIANKEIKDTEGVLYPNDSYPDLSIYGWLINPSTGGYQNQTDQTDHTYHSTLTFEKPTEILANKPEGQWLFKYDDTQGIFLMYNRESNQYFSLGKKIYKVNDSQNLYCISEGIQGSIPGMSQKFVIDTLRLSITSTEGLDGYAHSKKSGDAFDRVVLRNTAYKLGIQNGTFDNSIVFVQNSLTHNNTLVVDVKKDEGLSFYLVPCDTVPYGVTGYHDTQKKQPYDNLKRIQYALQERTTKRYVVFDSRDKKFMLDSKDHTDVDEALSAAEKFFFKEKEEGQYILLHCEEIYDKDDKEWIGQTTQKVYANIGDAFLHQTYMYEKNIADKFGFYSTAAPMYADIMKKLKGNTPGNNDTTLFKINLYSVQNRSGNQKYMLAAGQHNFLTEGIPDTRSDIIINSKAIGGLAYDSIKFSIIVDTAYVRRTPMKFDEYGNPTLDGKQDSSSVMPLYYLGMSSTNKKENVARHDSIPVKPLPDCDKCDYYKLNPKVSGNYLFVMTDSIEHGLDNIVKREDHCYHYWNTHHPRLRFVHATHEEDTMIVTSIHHIPKDTLIGGKITTKIEAMKETEWLAPQIYDENAPNNRPNYGLFAFEVNPNPFDPEVPEYALWNPASKKYIAYVNGNLIMEDQPSYYTLDIKSKGHSIVSNEMVRTSDVRVVAAQGKVIIQNAAGKKVFLQTALGKTLADTVLTSDREEMAAPAGIIFVSVEGEETVKTIVK